MNRIVFMADIIGSSQKNAAVLIKSFREAVEKVNRIYRKDILSPLTITLGDELQAVLRSEESALKVVFGMEAAARQSKVPFSLRVVVHEGAIDTPINSRHAYEMLGSGLAEAREKLNNMKASRSRFLISLRDATLSARLNLGMRVYQGIVDQWTAAQLKVVNAFEKNPDYRAVARMVKRDPTVIWKRKRSLMIEEYNSIKTLIMMMVSPAWKQVS